MTSQGESVQPENICHLTMISSFDSNRRTMRMCRRFSEKILGLVTVLGLAFPSTAQSQVSRQLEFRGGSGISTTGELSFFGQIGLNENEGRNSVELALVGYGTSSANTTSVETDIGIRTSTTTTTTQTAIIGGGIAANLLLRDGLEVSGPYFVVGTGVGLFMVDWALTNSTDGAVDSSQSLTDRVEVPRFWRSGKPPDWSRKPQNEVIGISPGSMFNLGIGQRFGRALDLRIQAPSILIVGSGPREVSFVTMLVTTIAIGI